MYYLTVFVMEAMQQFIFLLPAIALLHIVMIKMDKDIVSIKHLKAVIPHLIAVYAFCFFILLIFCVTDIPSLRSIEISASINFIPFLDVFTNTHQYILNIILFFPIGFLLPMLWRAFEKKRLTFALGFLLSLFIELIQIFSYRITDVDDLLMNTSGAIIGYFLFLLAKKIFPQISVFSIKRKNCWLYEPYFCFCFAWLIVFFG